MKLFFEHINADERVFYDLDSDTYYTMKELIDLFNKYSDSYYGGDFDLWLSHSLGKNGHLEEIEIGKDEAIKLAKDIEHTNFNQFFKLPEFDGMSKDEALKYFADCIYSANDEAERLVYTLVKWADGHDEDIKADAKSYDFVYYDLLKYFNARKVVKLGHGF